MTNTNKADTNKLAYIGAKPGTNKPVETQVRDSDAWFTPSLYTQMAKQVMGDIDLDPFSSAEANRSVKAKRFFSLENSAFENEWFESNGTVFMNPPYGRKLINAAIDAFLMHLSINQISQGIVLVNNATETIWFQSLMKYADAICLPDKRIAFETFDKKHVSGNTRGQVFIYFGQNQARFKEVFGAIGCVLKTF